MIFRDKDSVRPQYDERFPVIDLELAGTPGIGQAVRHGMDAADFAGGVGARAARVPRELFQTLGPRVGNVCRFALLRALLRAQNSRAFRLGSRAGDVCPRRWP